MGAILYIVFLFGGIALIGWVFSTIFDALEKRRKKIRDLVAAEILSGLDIHNIIANYRRKLAHIKYTKSDLIDGRIKRMSEQIYGSSSILINECAKCKEGNLILRSGKFGKFMGCARYPKCDYTSRVETARAEYKKTINEQVIDDMRQAYSKI